MEIDRRRYEREIERAFFTAWCSEMFARQSHFDQWDVALKKLRAARVGAGTSQPILDWRLEKEQMQAIRERYAAEGSSEKKGKKSK